jgi:hypothetical protein
MNKFDRKARPDPPHAVRGQSIRAITRITGASKNTVAKLLVHAGIACAAYQDRALRNLSCKKVQIDEIYALVYSKRGNVKHAALFKVTHYHLFCQPGPCGS